MYYDGNSMVTKTEVKNQANCGVLNSFKYTDGNN